MAQFFSGLYTALVTPFKNKIIDFTSLATLINKQIDAGVNGIVIAGSTGEAVTLSMEEYEELIAETIKIAKGKIQIVAGTGSNNTTIAIEMAKRAEDLGADALICVTPFYNKPSQAGLIAHYTAIHEATNLPIMLYTVPGRTGIDFSDETIIKLAELPRVLGLKDATSDLEKPLRLSKALKSSFALLSGEDSTATAFNVQGGVGCVSVASNIEPSLCLKVQKLCASGNYAEALLLQKQLLPLYKAMFVETNPVPVKYALSLKGLCTSEVRLPLVELSETSKSIVANVIKL